ncbi:hypothetical protein EPUL_006384 [Erysiphe pulchra]|uniref:Uncharacterized protein n=1 Tax=Erysiphe pulchra TaxID=225359 RepID=A0A2S4PYV3_9PEZI|nr:hypothetical protein EPUL_006384 [Erysiphe pulchra]
MSSGVTLQSSEFDPWSSLPDYANNFELNSFPLIPLDQEVSISCIPNALLKSRTNMSRARRQRRETLSSKKRRSRKRDTAFWHRAIERPDTKPVDRLVARLCHIEHRSWKEVQEIVIETTGVFNNIAAMQMKMTRLKGKMDADSPSISSILPVSTIEELSMQEKQRPLNNELCQEANFEGFNTQPNLNENWNCGPVEQPFNQNVFSSLACTPNGMCQENFALNSMNISKVGWATSENMPNGELYTQPDNIRSISLPEISYSLQAGNIPGFEWPFELQPAGNSMEYNSFPKVPYQGFERAMSFSM